VTGTIWSQERVSLTGRVYLDPYALRLG
jgi:hypothetical protein